MFDALNSLHGLPYTTVVARHLRLVIDAQQGRSTKGNHERRQSVSDSIACDPLGVLIGKIIDLDLIDIRLPSGNHVFPEECWLSSDNWCVLAGPRGAATASANLLSVYSVIADHSDLFFFLYEAYLNILRRPVDLEGLISFMTHFEIDKLSRHNVIKKIVESEEAMHLDARIVIAPTSVILEVLEKPSEKSALHIENFRY